MAEMRNKTDEESVLRGKFSIMKHKATFVNYLEVVISPDGVVSYAIPSHQMKLMQILMDQRGCTRAELERAIPREFYFDVLGWLAMETGFLAVWNDHCEGTPTAAQSKMLRRLTANGLYTGKCF